MLASGVTVIADRYTYSGIAYTLAKDRAADRAVFSHEWCVACERGLLRPDAVVFFDIDVATALRRGDAGGKAHERYETSPFLAAVKGVYDDVLRDPAFWHTVDARAAPDAVTDAVMPLVHRIIADARSRPTQRIV